VSQSEPQPRVQPDPPATAPARARPAVISASSVLGRPVSAGERAWYRVARGIVEGVCRAVWRVRVEGKENLPTDTPYVIAPVHRSYIDFLLIGCLTRRRVRYMGKDTLWSNKVLGLLCGSLGAFPVHRGSADREALRSCELAIAGGEPVVLFPEGARRAGPKLHPLFDGAAFVAARAGVPIVPVGIGGSERALPKGAKMVRPVKISVIIGRPLYPPPREGRERVSRKAVTALTAELQTSLQDLFDQARAQAG
jgi:1-acyl-sn-glycerol-3-phosphate acyltransferase